MFWSVIQDGCYGLPPNDECYMTDAARQTLMDHKAHHDAQVNYQVILLDSLFTQNLPSFRDIFFHIMETWFSILYFND